MGSTQSSPASSPVSSGPDLSWLEAVASDTSTSLRQSTSASAGLGQSLQGELLRQSRSLQQVAALNYQQFIAHIKELNSISSHFLDANGKQLVFAVKSGSDATPLLWKATVRIACVKVDANTKKVESYKALTLKEFVQVYNKLRNQSQALSIKDQDSPTEKLESQAEARAFPIDLLDAPTASTSAHARSNSHEECCICLERKNDLTLPCTHSYCLPCIEQWNVDHKTCPVCRETLASTKDGWVISDGPDSLEIATEIQKSLMSLTQ